LNCFNPFTPYLDTNDVPLRVITTQMDCGIEKKDIFIDKCTSDEDEEESITGGDQIHLNN